MPRFGKKEVFTKVSFWKCFFEKKNACKTKNARKQRPRQEIPLFEQIQFWCHGSEYNYNPESFSKPWNKICWGVQSERSYLFFNPSNPWVDLHLNYLGWDSPVLFPMGGVALRLIKWQMDRPADMWKNALCLKTNKRVNISFINGLLCNWPQCTLLGSHK